MLHHTDAFQVILKLLPTIEVQSRIHGLGITKKEEKEGKGKGEMLSELQKICAKPKHQVI